MRLLVLQQSDDQAPDHDSVLPENLGAALVSSRLRRRVLENFSYLGLKVDYEANVAFGEDAIITTADSKVKAALICTNEELVIARDTMHLVLENQD